MLEGIRHVDSGATLFRLTSWLYYYQAVWPWTDYSASLRLSCFICKTSGCSDLMRWLCLSMDIPDFCHSGVGAQMSP